MIKLKVQCRHLIPAINALEAGHNTRPHAQFPLSVLVIDLFTEDLTTESNFDS